MIAFALFTSGNVRRKPPTAMVDYQVDYPFANKYRWSFSNYQPFDQ